MKNFPEYLYFDLGEYVEIAIKWLNVTCAGFFEAISSSILWLLLKLETGLNWLPWWLVLILVFLILMKIRGWPSALLFTFLIFVIGTLGLWGHMMSTLAIILASVFISILIGVPLGILAAQYDGFDRVLTPILDAMQTLPAYVYLIPAIMFFGLGSVPATFSTILFAVPPAIRLTNLGIRRVSKEMVEAAESFGPSQLQLMLKIKLPQALPNIMAGVNQTTMMALSMVVIASMVGAGGLGLEVYIAINRIDIARGFNAGISIVFLAIIIDRATQGLAGRFSKKYRIE